MQKPSVPKGTRDFSPEEMVRRKYIFDTIEDVFRLYGYLPLETPAIENLSSLLGKYGEEGDRLLFKVLNSGNFLSDIPPEQLNPDNAGKLALQICEKGLRYDLTVPFARYVVQHRNDITFPFKRYQIQPVWRADKPQKGRYREFYQCDADIIGSNSLLNEAELIQIIDEVFFRLGMEVIIKINNRKVLAGIIGMAGLSGLFGEITVVLDKLDRIGINGVINELLARGIEANAVERLKPVLNLKGDYQLKTGELEKIIGNDVTGQQGLHEVKTLFRILGNMSPRSEILWDVPLARGLDYYTGTIIEALALDDSIGSVCGGGRYDDLAGVFGMPDISGVGISFGAERIFDVMSRLGLFPESVVTGTKILFVNLGEKEEIHILPLLSKVREAGISAEIYPDHAKLKKQMAFAHARQIPFVALIGEQEISEGLITLRNMQTGEQKKVNLEGLIKELM
jgi:histidyl-tRNA synthetase